MFDKKDDKLFDYAFGELDSQEAQMFEASLLKDEAGLSEVEFLKTLKQDLVGLRDIPEMQYSKERLRAAILEQGLKPKRTLPWLNWVLAPSAVACVAALGFVLLNGTSPKDLVYIPDSKMGTNKTENPKIAFNPETSTKVASNSELDRQTSPDINFDEYLYPETSKSSVRTSNKSVRASSRGGLVDHSTKEIDTTITPTDLRDEVAKEVVALNAGGAASSMAPGAVAMDAKMTEMAFANPIVRKASHEAEVDTTLIMIDKERDSGVGAAVATEVKNTANVVIGG